MVLNGWILSIAWAYHTLVLNIYTCWLNHFNGKRRGLSQWHIVRCPHSVFKATAIASTLNAVKVRYRADSPLVDGWSSAAGPPTADTDGKLVLSSLVRSARVLCNLPFQEGKKKVKSGFPESHIFEMPDYKSKGVLEHITFVSFINLDFRLFLESEFLVFCGAWQKIRLLIAKLGWQCNCREGNQDSPEQVPPLFLPWSRCYVIPLFPGCTLNPGCDKASWGGYFFT